MPNLKVYFDETLLPPDAAAIPRLLTDLRGLLCHDLAVKIEACQLAAIAVKGLPDQPTVNVELAYMPGPARSPDLLRAVAEQIRDRTAETFAGGVAVRMWALNSDSYLALK